MSFTASALVVEPDRAAAQELAGHLFTAGFECTVTESGDEAWSALAARRPNLILATLGAPALDRFQRRLRDEYFGQRPRLIGVTDAHGLAPDVTGIDFDAVIMRPIHSGELFTTLFADQPSLGTVQLDPSRLREMLKLTCLGSDLQASLEALARRLALIYGVSRCAVLAVASERHWLGQAGESASADDWPLVWSRCEQGLNAAAPLIIERHPARGRKPAQLDTLLSVGITSPSGEIIGAVCLTADGPRLFDVEARDALHDLATRLGVELNWRSVHDRLTNERDHLRETSMLDPMLGILARNALEQALQTELSRSEQSGGSVVVAIIDIIGLRHINDHYGHLCGDEALKHVANVARRMSRAQDIVGRSGDDEIAVVLGGTAMPGATQILDRIRNAIEDEPFAVEEDIPLVVRVGVGVTEAGGGDVDGDKLLERATASAEAASKRGGAIAIADHALPGAETRPNIVLERFEAGMTLGGMYQIVHEINRGAMGVVYRAEDLGLSRPVAIKMLRPDLVRDVELVQRFREEAGILASLNHDNLVRVYSFIEERDDVAFVMELVEGLSLDSYIADLSDHDKFITTERAAAIIHEIASALDAMHHAGVMHRDVKPGNVVLDRSRHRAVLVDVGLARRLGDKGEPAGTPGYIAPESFRGDPESPATDVYGLAATTYATLTGQPPFGRADDYRELLVRQLEVSPEPPSTCRPDLNHAVDTVILRGLSVRSGDRYPTAGQFAAALEVALGDDTIIDPPRPMERSERRLERKRRISTQPRVRAAGRSESRRSITIDIGSQGPLKANLLTRGIVFRSVSRVLGIRDANAWVHTIERTNQALADALSLRTSPMAWLSAEYFTDLFEAIASSGRHVGRFARQLGLQTVEQSFRRFYPSSPESLSPNTTLSALDILWRKYHTWASFEVTGSEDRSATVLFRGPSESFACAFAEGWLEAVVTMSGGQEARVRHLRCSARGDEHCELTATWK